MSKFNILENELARHPDYEFFLRFGPPKNLLSLEFGTGKELEENETLHYGASQSSFANHAMACLIDLNRDFNWQQGGFEMEEFYKRITLARMNIFLFTPCNYQHELATKVAYSRENGETKYRELFGDEKLFVESSEELEELAEIKIADLQDLDYEPSSMMDRTSTLISGDKKYARHHNITQSQQCLKSCDVLPLLGLEVIDIDYETDLGHLQIEDDNLLHHSMGLYRDRQDKIARVDEITKLAAEKALATTDEDEAMKYALVFAILRGYNLRSTIGACFAQEMSLRWIFVQKGWPQFQKAPGVYLDIEAAILDPECSPQEALEKLISKQITDCKTANRAFSDASVTLEPNSLFGVPQALQKNDFTIYLMETRRYRAQDLGQLITSEIAQEVFNIAAKNGDVNFFKMLKAECEKSADFKRQFEGEMSHINHEEIIQKAIEYGGEILTLVSELKPSNDPTVTNATTARQVSATQAKL